MVYLFVCYSGQTVSVNLKKDGT